MFFSFTLVCRRVQIYFKLTHNLTLQSDLTVNKIIFIVYRKFQIFGRMCQVESVL